MNRLVSKLVLALSLGAAVAGPTAACTTDTNTIATTDVDSATIKSTIEVTSNGVGVTVRLSWFTGQDTTRALVVGPGDRLVVRAPDAPARDLSAFEEAYYAYLPTTSQTVTIALLRPSGELAFSVPLPPDFTLEAPPAPIVRSNPLEIKWVADATRGASLSIESPCFQSSIERSVAVDTGSFTFFPGDFPPVKTACTLFVAVRRSGTFSASSPFLMSGVVRQVRTLRLETNP